MLLGNVGIILRETFLSPTQNSVLAKGASEVLEPDEAIGKHTAITAPRSARTAAKPEPASRAAATRTQPSRSLSTQITLSPHFKIVFLSIFALTIASGIGQVILAIFFSAMSADLHSVFEGLGFAWKSGIGAIFGLLGGKVT
jgi:hypothetical protein